ncbi:MAG: fumarate hydratase [Candidatus Omnitrophota bacterium]|nr:fumarate hydratase [Candidatus Omnitrophota bacterium]
MNIQKQIETLVAKANFSLRPDVLRILQQALAKETSKKAREALGWIIANAQIAKKENLAICQDTGLPVVFIEAGKNISISEHLTRAVKEAVATGYKNNYLRPSIVDPLRRGTSSYRGAICHIDFVSGLKGVRITLLPKGFGCENKSQLKLFNPTASTIEIEDFIVESVKKAGPEACPPFVVGVGIGGTSDYALLLAKKALLGNIAVANKDASLNILEKRLLKRINSLGIGPMGLGGKCTALAVKIKSAPTHIAGLPVGVNISCHALRSATVSLKYE